MTIVINLDVMLAKRKLKSKELAMYVGITEQNLSLLKSGKVRGIRFNTLEKICERLACQPGDIMEWVAGGAIDSAIDSASDSASDGVNDGI
ncbi:MAG: helix-turn-helix transcriptional regulator [Undibacterium sp.]|nr:helix-turn-helix transcriptional regulator [Undibacterium sp.]